MTAIETGKSNLEFIDDVTSYAAPAANKTNDTPIEPPGRAGNGADTGMQSHTPVGSPGDNIDGNSGMHGLPTAEAVLDAQIERILAVPHIEPIPVIEDCGTGRIDDLIGRLLSDPHHPLLVGNIDQISGPGLREEHGDG